MSARFRVHGPLDTGRPQEGTVTIDRDRGLFAVRPLRSRREYVLPLADVAAMVVARVIKSDMRAKLVLVLLSLLCLGAAACGSASAATPSAVVPVTSPASPAPEAWALPSDPSRAAYFSTLASVSGGEPQRWQGGPFHHCVGAGVDATMVDALASRMTALTGIQRTDSGACNVTWVIDASPDDHVETVTYGTATAIYSARVRFPHVDGQRYLDGLHEAGHVIGLRHSPRREDLMFQTHYDQPGFTADELAVIAWIYHR